MPELHITPEFLKALELMEGSSRHIFITGKAGTGKSTLLQHFRSTTKKSVAVLAPTGVAALNVQGQTIHSFFKFRPDTTPESISKQRISLEQADIYKHLDTLVIDEVSMLRADLLDSIDAVLRKYGPERGRSFGGVQMLFFGDLYQLPPVVTMAERPTFQGKYAGAHFFHAEIIQEIELHLVELTTVYRQQEAEFIDILNAIRSNTATAAQLELLNTRYTSAPPPEEAITLTTTNDLATLVNDQRLSELPGDAFSWQASSTGTFNDRDVPTPALLSLKNGARVMMLTNDGRGRWVNGSIGTVTGFYDEDDSPTPTIDVKLDSGATIHVNPNQWELFKHVFNEESGTVQPEITGTYTQYPLRLAWAVTIHKSQGKTFDTVVIDLGRGTFSPGQLYVALSRCRTLSGITLKQPVTSRHLMSSPTIKKFTDSFSDGYRFMGQPSFDFEF